MTGITRERASQVAADFLGGESRYLGTYYKTYAATDAQGRVNIPPQTGQQNGGNRSRVTVEMSPGVRLQVQAVE